MNSSLCNQIAHQPNEVASSQLATLEWCQVKARGRMNLLNLILTPAVHIWPFKWLECKCETPILKATHSFFVVFCPWMFGFGGMIGTKLVTTAEGLFQPYCIKPTKALSLWFCYIVAQQTKWCKVLISQCELCCCSWYQFCVLLINMPQIHPLLYLGHKHLFVNFSHTNRNLFIISNTKPARICVHISRFLLSNYIYIYTYVEFDCWQCTSFDPFWFTSGSSVTKCHAKQSQLPTLTASLSLQPPISLSQALWLSFISPSSSLCLHAMQVRNITEHPTTWITTRWHWWYNRCSIDVQMGVCAWGGTSRARWGCF